MRSKIQDAGSYSLYWSGLDYKQEIVPEGNYVCRIKAEDAQQPEIYEELSQNIYLEYLPFIRIENITEVVFSPNNDGYKDFTTIDFQTFNRDGYCFLVIESTSSEQIKHANFGCKQPGIYTYAWNGTDDGGNTVPDGFYNIYLRVQRNETSILNNTDKIFCAVDTTPPKIALLLPPTIYFTNAVKTTVPIEYAITDVIQEKVGWDEGDPYPTIETSIKIYNRDGALVRTLVNRKPRRVAVAELGDAGQQKNYDTWDGKNDNGIMVSDGGILLCDRIC